MKTILTDKKLCFFQLQRRRTREKRFRFSPASFVRQLNVPKSFFILALLSCVSYFAIQSEVFSKRKNDEDMLDGGDERSTRRLQDNRNVILLSVGRSGSSMTWELLSTFHDSIFTAFEPLWPLRNFELYKNESNITPKIVQTLLTDLFNCNFRENPETNYLFDNWSRSQIIRRNCRNSTVEKVLRVPILGDVLKKMYAWFHLNQCHTSLYRLVKVIRLPEFLSLNDSFNLLKSSMEADGSLMIIGLIRDPRSTHLSREKAFFRPTSEFNKTCSLLQKVFQTVSMLKENYPQRVLGVKYETIVAEPTASAKTLSSFMGFGNELSEKTKNWIEANMMADESTPNERRCAFDVKKRNSTQHVTDWKKQVWNQKSTGCEKTIQLLKYD